MKNFSCQSQSIKNGRGTTSLDLYTPCKATKITNNQGNKEQNKTPTIGPKEMEITGDVISSRALAKRCTEPWAQSSTLPKKNSFNDKEQNGNLLTE